MILKKTYVYLTIACFHQQVFKLKFTSRTQHIHQHTHTQDSRYSRKKLHKTTWGKALVLGRM